VEVMLDKGVSERELNDDEKPWLIMQRNRRVCLVSHTLMSCCCRSVSPS